MSGDNYEPNRVLGFPQRRKPRAGQDREPHAGQDREPHAGQDREPQRVMGFPVDRFGPVVDGEWIESLGHPIRTYRRWLRRRHLGPYAVDEDDPAPKR
jgi:hypothetical protein